MDESALRMLIAEREHRQLEFKRGLSEGETSSDL